MAAVFLFFQVSVYGRYGEPAFLREFGGALPGAVPFGDPALHPVFVETFFRGYVYILPSRSLGKLSEILYPYGFGITLDRLRKVRKKQVIFIPHAPAPFPPDRERPPLPRPVSSRSTA